MESLGDLLKQLDHFNQTRGGISVQERVRRLRLHPIYRRWQEAQSIDVSDEQLNRSLSDVVQFVRENENCERCPGLSKCPNTVRGFRPSLTMGDRGMLGVRMSKCDKQLAADNQLAKQNLIRSHSIPLEIMQANFQTIERDAGRVEALNAMMEFCLSYRESSLRGRGIFLYGPLGVGKSRMMAAVARKLADQGVASLMVYVPDFFREMKEAIGEHTLSNKTGNLNPYSLANALAACSESPKVWFTA